MPCPEVKKEDPVQVSQLLKTYITRNIVNGFDLSVKSVTKKSKLQHIVHTTYDCETCKKTNVQFKIMKNQIEQVCSCKNRKHILSDKIIRVL